MLDEINDVEQDYDKLEISDKNFYAKRRKKNCFNSNSIFY